MPPRLLPLLLLSTFAVSAATRVELAGDRGIPAIAFSATEIERAAALAPAGAPLVVSLEIDPATEGNSQDYRIERLEPDRLRVVGGSAPRTMYGGLDVAEALRLGTTATLDDYIGFALLGHYYADKIRAACALALYDAEADPADQATALRHLEAALQHWKRYAAVRDARYVPALYDRVGQVDITALTAKVAADLDLARQWQTGSVRPGGPRGGTEKGFRR